MNNTASWVELVHGDCLDAMKDIPSASIDMVLADPPYGTTACKWDSVIPFEPMWEHLHRIVKPRGAICLFGSEPFSSNLRMSNISNYKYDWVWNKKLAGNGILAKIQPLKIHELIHVFNSKVYYPQKTTGKLRAKMTSGIKTCELNNGDGMKGVEEYRNDQYYPVSILEFGIGNLRKGRLHPTQKPVDLLQYLIRTYTLEGQTVLDFCMGSGSTGEACINTGRNFVGIEKELKYFSIANERIESAKQTVS